MKLALLGHPIAHSLSPSLYREFLKEKLQSYDLLDIADAALVPTLEELAARYDGLSITTPHKKHFVSAVTIPSPLVRELGSINTIAFRESGIFATNTDLIAVERILRNWKDKHSDLSLILLGDGVMGRLTVKVADALHIPIRQFARSKGDNLTQLDLSSPSHQQTIVINSCSRNFVFQGKLHPDHIFWDYNYSFRPHQESLPSQVKSYIDGQEMLRLQALAAIEFWSAT